MDYLKIFSYSLIFLIGFLSCVLVSLVFSGTEMPLGLNVFGNYNKTLKAPGNWIKQQDISVYDNAIVINIENASLGKYASTGSMLPLLDENSCGIRIIPKSEQEINVGDIVTFEQNRKLIIHRVIEKGKDETGVWFITKGDNSEIADRKIRFKDIRYITIGILW